MIQLLVFLIRPILGADDAAFYINANFLGFDVILWLFWNDALSSVWDEIVSIIKPSLLHAVFKLCSAIILSCIFGE